MRSYATRQVEQEDTESLLLTTTDIVSNRVVNFYVFALWASMVQPWFDFDAKFRLFLVDKADQLCPGALCSWKSIEKVCEKNNYLWWNFAITSPFIISFCDSRLNGKQTQKLKDDRSTLQNLFKQINFFPRKTRHLSAKQRRVERRSVNRKARTKSATEPLTKFWFSKQMFAQFPLIKKGIFCGCCSQCVSINEFCHTIAYRRKHKQLRLSHFLVSS